MSGAEKPRRGSVDRSEVRRVRQHELDTAERLADLSENVTFIPSGHDPRPDARLSDGKSYEFKSPIGENRSTILGRLERASRRGKQNFVLDLSRSAVPLAEACDLARYAVDSYPGVERIRLVGREASAGPLDITIEKGCG